MDINRRRLIKTAGLGSAASLAPLSGFALGEKGGHSPNLIVQSGLPTDWAFAQGVGASHVLPIQLTIENYSYLVEVFRKTPGKKIFALVETANGILIEEAARDSGARLSFSEQVQSPSVEFRDTWARELGKSIADQQRVNFANPQAGETLQLIALRT